jgi:DNA/RNA-binding domain of Phe-tRNA-synthetase-like protein
MKLACMSCNVSVIPYHEVLWHKILHVSTDISQSFEIEEIGQLPAIYAARKAYRALGKDPARYRLSAEALLRRIVKGEDLYQISNVVDIVNLVSIQTGFSIGGYDYHKIKGEVLFDVGKEGEPYSGVGRGQLNIEGLPVLKDEQGSFGSPTSDSMRSSVTLETSRFLMVFFAFGNHEKLNGAIQMAKDLLSEYASAENFSEVML